MQMEQRFRFQDKQAQLDLTLAQSIDQDRYAIAAFGPIGGAVFSAQWADAVVRETRSPIIPPGMTAQTLLSEMQLALWSIIEIRKGILDPDITVVESGLERVISHGSEPMIRIKYTLLPPYKGDVEFVNLDTGHQWMLETLSFQPLTANLKGVPVHGGI
jgi:hypothetical protein